MDQSELIICQNKNDISNDESVIVLSDVIQKFDQSESDRLYELLVNMDPSHEHDVPIYQIIANQVWDGIKLTQSSPRSMETLIQLYRYMSEQVTEETEQIQCFGVSGVYLDLLRDFADNEDIELIVAGVSTSFPSIRPSIIRSLVWLLISLLDAVISLLLRPLFSPTEADILVKYPVFRADTFQSIESCIDINIDSTFTLLTISYFTEVRSAINEKTTIVPIRCFTTAWGMLKSYYSVASIIYDVTFTRQAETAVVKSVEDTTGVRLKRTIGSQFRRCVWSNMDAFLYYMASDELFKRGQYNSVLLTTSGPNGKSLLLPAVNHGVNTYCLPHSIRTRPVSNFGFYDAVFVEGQIVDYCIDSARTKYIKSGLPKHMDIYQRRNSAHKSDDPSTLLIATQPFCDQRRREFIYDVVPSVYNQTEYDIIIKIHPGEKISFYRQLLSDLDLDPKNTGRICITNNSLYSRIVQSNLLLTINSNVGIESVILGTPAASYNAWSPDIRDPMYAKFGPISSLRTSSEVISFLQDLDVNSEISKQEFVLDNLYYVHDNSITKITARIQDELTKPTDYSNTAARDE